MSGHFVILRLVSTQPFDEEIGPGLRSRTRPPIARILRLAANAPGTIQLTSRWPIKRTPYSLISFLFFITSPRSLPVSARRTAGVQRQQTPPPRILTSLSTFDIPCVFRKGRSGTRVMRKSPNPNRDKQSLCHDAPYYPHAGRWFPVL